ncbi:MAG: HAMP domain-containing protein [Bacteroidetes bacterium]|nr:MAG: HAMP domain-containing protein [Bacteroidota bacterium]
MRFKEGFGFKLLKAFIAVIFSLSFVFTSYTVYHEYRKYKEDFLYNGKVITGLLAYSSKIGIFSENKELLKDISQGILNHKDIITVSIYNADLKVLYIANKNYSRKQPDQAEGDLRRDITQRLITPQSLEVVETGNTFEFTRPAFMEIAPNIEEKLYFDYKRSAKTEKIIGYVKIVFDKNCLHKEMISILLRNAIMVLILILSSAAIIYIAVRRVTKPLERLTEGVRRLGTEENFEKISIESKDEIGRIASTFNEMAENLRKREKEKRLLEENLAQAKKMEAVGTLARGIAHDFNNILGIIKGSVYMIKKKLDADDPIQKYALEIHDSIIRAKELIEALIAFSKTQKIRSAPMDINELIKEMNPLFSSTVSENIEYIENLTDEPLIVMADHLQMEQVITNMISNARDAMPEGGRLFIKTEVARIDADNARKEPFKKPGGYALISISDTGVGMSETTKSKIFEPFFTTKEVGKGTGLGLSIVYGIIEEHKGYIDVDTKKGEGTTFRIHLPLIVIDKAEADN